MRQPVALAVAASAGDFAGFGFLGEADYAGYLARTDAQLRVLHGHGLDVHLRLLEPVDYADFCEEHQLDPGDPVARVAYAADPALAGEPFRYGGQSLAALLPALVDDHRARVRISLGCASLLDSLGWAEEPEQRLAGVLGYVSAVYLALAAGAGEGRHRVTLRSVGLLDGEVLAASAELCVAAGAPGPAGREVEAFCVTLAAAVAGCGAGELLLRAGRRVYGWALVDGYLRPMTAVETAAVLAPGEVARPAAGFALER
ncbi:hypothetical protein CFP65_6263 [Kitasatospora sp. MMS16-BH015]|uniref:hypothetical protein n=1 Tax=Kitasatospora sp. MMS16-BH015 TaxID=2018025 RepID=UPI000CA1E0EA|nr:hypothetical protein [Kitasatospora sp. MMS16-BH015]AUG80925.1 hypothetical protein CFP65_6263 [Kitasatospora sp. MMS16-BH015]